MIFSAFGILDTCLFLTACSSGGQQELPDGLHLNVERLPSIECFSDTAYEDFAFHFSPVTHAVYHHDGIETIIEPDDPRLFRLLNLLAYSEAESLSAWRQGYLEASEINQYANRDTEMLEITFDCTENTMNHTIAKTPKILISGHTYLLYADTQLESWPLDDGIYAEQSYPYYSLLYEMLDAGSLTETDLYPDIWGQDNWINLLTYAGF